MLFFCYPFFYKETPVSRETDFVCLFGLGQIKRNAVARKRSNDVLATLVTMFGPYGHKYKKDIRVDVFFQEEPNDLDDFNNLC